MTTGPQVRTPSSTEGVLRFASARFRAPIHVRKVIERWRVLDGLRGSAGRQLTMIHAPAGYGKATLAGQWLEVLQKAGASIAWLGLHRDDNAW